jgi:cation-transporting ATPase E
LYSGVELAALADAEFDVAAAQGRVFGRISPEQKARLVDALQRRGAYVAMTGDGVNDVMSLKKANLGIAMESGAQATRAVADIVLLRDTFAALPAAFGEGQRVRRGLQGVLGLFLTRVFVVVIALVLCSVVRVGFPFSPANITLLTLLTVGIPTFGIALWAHPGPPARSLVKSLVAFVLPAAVTLAVAGFAVYTIFYLTNDVSLADLRSAPPGALISGEPVARDALTCLLVLAGIGLVPLACPPSRWWAVIERTDHDWRPTWLALAMLPLYVVIVTVEPIREFFDTQQLPLDAYLVISAVVVAWLVLLRYVYATHVFERYFGMELVERDGDSTSRPRAVRS